MTISSSRLRRAALRAAHPDAVPGGVPAPAADDPNPAKAEAELKAVRSQIDKVQAEMERDAGRRDKLTREIEESEKTVSGARGELDKLRRERAVHTARRAELAAARRSEEAVLGERRAALAGQIRAASMIGQRRAAQTTAQPARSGADRPGAHVLPVFRPCARQPDRRHQLALAELATLDAALAEEEARLAALEEQQKGELSRLQIGARTPRPRAGDRSKPSRRTAPASSSGSRISRAASRSWCASCGARSSASTNSPPTARTRSRSCAASCPGRWPESCSPRSARRARAA